jgi:CheY-like chemotaxis protein
MLSLLSRKGRVLVLDDDAAMQRLITTLLRRHGYRVDVVSSGTQAIDKLRVTPYQAMLLDLMTPTDGGMTVIRHLRETNPAALRRVAVVTASPDSILRSIEGEVAAVVQKPFDAKVLLETVDRIAGM